MRRRLIPRPIYVGWSPDEALPYRVAVASLLAHTDPGAVHVLPISRATVEDVYDRPTTRLPSGQLFDEISEAPMSTDHAIARFFVPYLQDHTGWALFTDGDVLFRRDVRELFALADPRFALMVVQHEEYRVGVEKKAGQIQQPYPRKNWSSVILWNCAHPAHQALTIEVLNTWPGRDLHALRWLEDDQIGGLPAAWNFLIGVHDPAIAHFTSGVPTTAGHGHDLFADEWRAHLGDEPTHNVTGGGAPSG